MEKYKKSIFIFRRDLRVEDNTALIEALKNSERVIPCFIFDERQVGQENEYRSTHSLQFMIESLEDLEKQLKNKGGKLYYFFGKAEDFIEKFIEKQKIDAVFVNRDYTPFSIKRDKKIKEACEQKGVKFEIFDDALLNPPEKVRKTNSEPYSVFTAYYNLAKKLEIQKPEKNNYSNYFSEPFKFENKSQITNIKNLFNENLAIRGGREEGKKILSQMRKNFEYALTHNFPSKKTTMLSAHLKFGTISIRETYYSIQKEISSSTALIRQLYWRDFFTQLAFHNPKVFGKSFHEKYDKISWSNNEKKFSAWKEGKTGFPLVDAGMRELNKTGFMHNRVRMITASFLVKDLHIDWREGEKYFAQKLVDYDPCVNNGNWQWCASTGADAQPYFRVFNPLIQGKKFDPNAEYIKKWIPELKELSPQEIHSQKKYPKVYPKQIVNHSIEAKKALEYFKKALK